MEKLNFLFFISAILYLSSCSYKNTKVEEAITKNEIYLNIDRDSIFESSEIIDSIEIIPLKSTSYSEFNRIRRLQVVDGYFVILSDDLKSILLFDKNGSFYSRIDASITTKSPEQFGSFTVNRKNKTIVVFEFMNGMLYMYNFKGTKISNGKQAPPYKSVEMLGDKYAYYTGFRPITSIESSKISTVCKGSEIVVKDFKSEEIVFHLDLLKGENPRNDLTYSSESDFYHKTDSTLIFNHSYSYTFFEINENGVGEKYLINFPDHYKYSADFLNDSSVKNRILLAKTKQNKDKVWNIGDIFFTNNSKALLNVQRHNKLTNNYYCDFKSKKYYAFEKLIYDSSTHFIPLLYNNFHFAEMNVGYTSIAAAALIKWTSDPKAASYFSNHKELSKKINQIKNTDNPIIIKVYFKNET